MFEGLGQYEAVKVGDNYFINLSPKYGSAGKHKIGDVETERNNVCTQDLDVYLIPKSVEVVDYYQHKEDQSKVLSSEEMNEKSKMLNTYREWDDSLDQYIFPTREDKELYDTSFKYISEYKAVKKIVQQEPQKVEINVVGEVIDTGSAFIESAINVGKVSWRGGSGIFRVKGVISIACDEFWKISKENKEDTFKNPTHSGLKYAQINGTYVFKGSDFYINESDTQQRVYSTLEEAKVHEQTVRSYIRSRAEAFLKKNQILPESCRASILREVNRLHTAILGLDVKQKSRASRSSCLNAVKVLIEKLENHEQ